MNPMMQADAHHFKCSFEHTDGCTLRLNSTKICHTSDRIRITGKGSIALEEKISSGTHSRTSNATNRTAPCGPRTSSGCQVEQPNLW